MIRPPSEKTLAKYGLTEMEWLAILGRQGNVCAVCRLLPKSGRFNVDHDHVKGWKKLAPEIRKIHVRGVICHWCNRTLVGRGITVEKSKAVTAYLEQHRERMIAYAIAPLATAKAVAA